MIVAETGTQYFILPIGVGRVVYIVVGGKVDIICVGIGQKFAGIHHVQSFQSIIYSYITTVVYIGFTILATFLVVTMITPLAAFEP